MRVNWPHLDFLHLFLVGGVHLLQALLQLPVPLQEGLPQLRRQLEVCRRDGVSRSRAAFVVHGCVCPRWSQEDLLAAL